VRGDELLKHGTAPASAASQRLDLRATYVRTRTDRNRAAL